MVFAQLEIGKNRSKFSGTAAWKDGTCDIFICKRMDDSPVAAESYHAPIKSIGNSTTTPRDLECDQDVQIILMALAESVAARLRKHGFKCNVVSISIRDNELYHFFTTEKKFKNPLTLQMRL